MGSRWLGITVGLGWLLAAVSSGSPEGPAPQIEQLSWLGGCWAADSEEPGSGEQWMPPAGGTMFGVSRTVSHGETVFFETMQLREAGATLEFVASPLGQSTTVFPVIEIGPDRVVFENPQNDFPQRVAYWRTRDRLEARIEGTVSRTAEDGSVLSEDRAAEFRFQRVRCEALGAPALASREGLLSAGMSGALLFVGNSLTYSHELPGLVGTLLEGAGIESDIEAAVGPNLGLQDHWESRSLRKRVRSGKFDYVILQQGPSATEGRPSLLAYGSRFAALAREGGAIPAFYMVWPARSRAFDVAGVSESYRRAAEESGARLFAAGDAWQAAMELDPTLELYGEDGFHPSMVGSALAALVIFQAVRAEEADPPLPDGWNITPEDWETLLAAAGSVRREAMAAVD